MGTGVRFAADMGSHLLRAAWTPQNLSGGERANQTPSGKVASAIRASMDQPEFKGNKFAGSTDTTLEPDAVAFVNSK